jgi:hypothetical protein
VRQVTSVVQPVRLVDVQQGHAVHPQARLVRALIAVMTAAETLAVPVHLGLHVIHQVQAHAQLIAHQAQQHVEAIVVLMENNIATHQLIHVFLVPPHARLGGFVMVASAGLAQNHVKTQYPQDAQPFLRNHVHVQVLHVPVQMEARVVQQAHALARQEQQHAVAVAAITAHNIAIQQQIHVLLVPPPVRLGEFVMVASAGLAQNHVKIQYQQDA